MRTRFVAAMVIALVAVTTGAAAQEPDVIFSAVGPPDGGAGQVRIAAGVGQIKIGGGPDGVPFGLPIDVLAVEPLEGGKVVTGSPYAAEITTEIMQQLADGNRIERRTTSSVARDGEGRVRREQQVTAIGPILPGNTAQIVTITDPVAKVHYALDADRKVAMQLPTPLVTKFETSGPGRPSLEVREKGERVTAPLGAGSVPDARTESLGTRDIEGVMAEGTRVTVTIPAGAIGNQAAIDIVNERWYSPELQTVVLSRRSDPRFGETMYRLTNIVRAEPAAELFQVPADYRVEQPNSQFGVRKLLPPPGQ
jgi:hypothetical protein